MKKPATPRFDTFKPALQRLLLATCSTLVCLCLMEFAFSAFRFVRLGSLSRQDMIAERQILLLEKYGPLNQEDPNRGWENSLVLHPLFGYVSNPKSRDANNYGFNTEHDFELTEEGYRLTNVDREKAIVVGIFGGSFASQTEQLAGDYFEEQLRPLFPGREVYVINFAHGGHALPQTAFIFAYFHSMLDVTVFVDGVNELWNYVNNNKAGCPPEYAKAAHYLYKTSATEMDVNRFEQTVRIIELRKRLARTTRYSLMPVVRQSALVHYVWERIARKMEGEIARENSAIEQSYYEARDPFVEMDDQRLLSICGKQYGRYHGMVHELCDADGILDIHTLQPNPYVAQSKAKYSDAETHNLEADQTIVQFVVKNGYQYLRQELQALARQGVTGKDLSFIYKDETDDVWTDNCHANEHGYRIVVDHLVALIRESRPAENHEGSAEYQATDDQAGNSASTGLPANAQEAPQEVNADPPRSPAAPGAAAINVAEPQQTAPSPPSKDLIAFRTRAVRPLYRAAFHQDAQPVIQVSLRYRSADAGEVLFVWGLGNWSILPEKRPPGTVVVRNTVMQTPMKREGDDFVLQFEAQDNARLDFGFLITQTSGGDPVRIWRDDGGKNFTRTLSLGNADEVVDLEEPLPSGVFWLLSASLSILFAWGAGIYLRRGFSSRAAKSSTEMPTSQPPR